MPYEHHCEPQGVLISYSGTLRPSEVLESDRVIAADPRFDLLRYSIVDLRAVQAMPITREDVAHFDAFLKGPACTNPNILISFVATHPDVLRVLAYYDEIADSSNQVRVCSTMAEARVNAATWRSGQLRIARR